MTRLAENADELEALVGLVAAANGIPTAFVEKDFWVVEVLRAVGDYLDPRATAVFKGGTSLSRVYRIINRFSEDVDLLIVFSEGVSKNARGQILKRMCAAVAGHLRLHDSECELVGSTTGIKRNVRYHYPARSRPSGAVRDGVLLEAGARGGDHPSRTAILRSLVADHAIGMLGEGEDTWDEFAPVTLRVLAPERTLLEKLAALHTAAVGAAGGDTRDLQRGARHFYDISRLLDDQRVVAELEKLGRDGVAGLVADIERHSREAGFPCAARPEAGYGASPAFDPGARSWELTEAAYRQACELIYDHPPSLLECADSVRARGDLL